MTAPNDIYEDDFVEPIDDSPSLTTRPTSSAQSQKPSSWEEATESTEWICDVMNAVQRSSNIPDQRLDTGDLHFVRIELDAPRRREGLWKTVRRIWAALGERHRGGNA